MALARDALVALVGHAGGLEADQWHHAAQEQVDLPEPGKLLQHAGAHQAVVCVVKDDLGAHGVEDFIEALRGKALKKRVGVALAAHAVHDVAAVAVGVHHGVHRVDVVLAVAVNGNRNVAATFGLHQARQHGILVAAVAALADADIVRVTRSQVTDNFPRPVLRAVVHKQHAAFRADLARGGQVGKLL